MTNLSPTPDGWVLTPRKPTEAMLDAYYEEQSHGAPAGGRSVWSAMLAAAPSTPDTRSADVPVGMKPWAGGDSAPEDWDGGPVLFRNRKLSVQSPDWRWKWKEPHYGYDIIAYTPKSQPPQTADTDAMLNRLRVIDAKLTAGPWDVWRERTDTRDAAISELMSQVSETEPFAGAVFLLNAGGKCPATTGCGPTSEANAHALAELRNLLPDILAALSPTHTVSDMGVDAVDPELIERVRYAVEHPDAKGFSLAKAGMTRHDFRRILTALSQGDR